MNRPSVTRKYLARFVCIVLFFYFGVQPLLSFMKPAAYLHMPSRQPCHPHQKIPELTEPALVPLEAHIMSKCPDAKVTTQAPYATADANILVGLLEVDGSTDYAKSDG